MLKREQLGDRKLSQLLRELQRLGHKKVIDEFIRTISTSRLPDQLQPVLATQPPDTTLERLGELADTVFDLVPQHQMSQMNATTSGNTLNSCNNEFAQKMLKPHDTISQLTEQVAAFTKQVSNLINNSKQKYRSRSNSRSRYNNKNYSNQNNQRYKNKNYNDNNSCCWYQKNLAKQQEIVNQVVLSNRKTLK